METYPPSVNALVGAVEDTGIPRPLLVQEARIAIEGGEWENLSERINSLKK